MSALSDSLRDLSKGLSTLAVVVGPNHPLVAADPLNESADLCEEAAMTIEGYESKLATLTARCAELERELERLADAAECMVERGRPNESIPWALYAKHARAALAKVTT